MATYRIACVDTRDCTAGRHVSGVGIDVPGGPVRVGVEEVWESLGDGDWLYAFLDDATTFVRAVRCACGELSLKPRRRPGSSSDLMALPRCEASTSTETAS